MNKFYLSIVLYCLSFSYLRAQNYYDSLGTEVLVQQCEECKSDVSQTFKYYFDGNLLLVFTCAKKKYDGVYIKYYENGIKAEEIIYKSGKKHGLNQSFYASGNVYESTHYKSGKKHGISKFFYSEGNLQSEISYKSGKKHGYTIYYDTVGEMTSKYDYKNNLLIEEPIYYQNGQIVQSPTHDDDDIPKSFTFEKGLSRQYKKEIKRLNYYSQSKFFKKMKKRCNNSKNNLQEVRITYDEVGNLDRIENYKRNELHGVSVEYLDNQSISYQYFKKGEQYGKFVEWRWFDYLIVEHYKKDLRHGKYVKYYDGKLDELSHYKNDMEHGITKSYYTSGYLEYKIYMYKDESTRGKQYDKSQKVKDNLWYKIRTALPFFMPKYINYY